MEKQKLGKTDLEVSRLGFGGARIGLEEVDLGQVDSLLNGLLDMGVTLIDTAASYHDSEEMIGKFIGKRRDEFVLATKCGQVIGDASGEPWSMKVISESIDRSLKRLATDHLDLVQLHSCSAEVLRAGEAAEAVVKAKEAGKTRYVGYSGDGENALEAVRMGVFDTLQTSFNVVDQGALTDVLPAAVEANMGIIAKRPIANGAIRKESSPYDYADTYWERSQKFRIPDGAPEDGIELAFRFTFSHNQIDTAIVGTTNLDHARSNIKMIGAGLLPANVVESFHEQFRQLGRDWKGLT